MLYMHIYDPWGVGTGPVKIERVHLKIETACDYERIRTTKD